MLLSEALRKWKKNLSTRTPVEYVLTLRADINTFSDAAQALESENAKLRELVWTLANCAAGHGCDFCPINGGYGYVGERDMCESVHARMVELGIEADDEA